MSVTGKQCLSVPRHKIEPLRLKKSSKVVVPTINPSNTFCTVMLQRLCQFGVPSKQGKVNLSLTLDLCALHRVEITTLWGRGLSGDYPQHGTLGTRALVTSVCCKVAVVWLQEKIKLCGRCRLLLRCLWQCAQTTCKLQLVCTAVFFSLSSSTNASGLLKEGKSHELMWRNIATLSLGRRITLSTAVLSPEIPQHRIRLRWLPAKVASKIVCD